MDYSATTSTDTTDNWADGESHTLRIDVSSTGIVTYKIDGATPTVLPAAYTFDDGEVVTPFFYLLHTSDASESLILESFTCGKLGL